MLPIAQCRATSDIGLAIAPARVKVLRDELAY